VALALGPVPVDIADDIGDLCEAVAWFRDTELSYTVAGTVEKLVMFGTPKPGWIKDHW
jgi:hypothetical protein